MRIEVDGVATAEPAWLLRMIYLISQLGYLPVERVNLLLLLVGGLPGWRLIAEHKVLPHTCVCVTYGACSL